MTAQNDEIGEVVMSKDQQNIIIYNTSDGKASVSLYAEDEGPL
jgi:hypothetical protein